MLALGTKVTLDFRGAGRDELVDLAEVLLAAARTLAERNLTLTVKPSEGRDESKNPY